jgi:hypothetical protein
LGFICGCKKVNMFFVFSYLISAENKSANKIVGKVFLMIKLVEVHGFTRLLSHKVVVVLSAR